MLSSSRRPRRWTNVRPGKSQTCWSSLWNPCCWVQVREASAPYWSRCASSVGRTWAPMRSPSALWHYQRCEGLRTFHKKLHIFLKEVIQTNSMERRWWHLTPGLSWQPTEWWKCQVWGFVFQSFFSENIMGREKHRESLWTVWKNSAGWISKNISLITDKFGEQDYTP